MAEPVNETAPATQVDPGAVNPVATPETTPSPDTDLDAKLGAVKAELESKFNARLAEKDNVISQYQAALGQAIQQRTAPVTTAPDPASQFDDTSKHFVRTEATATAQKVVDEAIRRITLLSEAQQKIGNDADLQKAGNEEFMTLKQSPYYAGLPEETIAAIAADRAQAKVIKQRMDTLRQEYNKLKDEGVRSDNATGASLPRTSGSLARPTASDPDADLKAFMNDPEQKKMFGRFIQNASIDPLSEQTIRWMGRDQKIKDLYRSYAVRAVRTGFRTVDPATGGMVTLRMGAEETR